MRIPMMFATLCLLSAAATAAPPLDMKPGLWEHSFSMSSESGVLETAMAEVQKQLELLPAAQRQMMERMLESQGISLRAGGSTIRICLTPELIARGELPQQEGCQQEIVEQSSTKLRVRFACTTNPPARGEGEIVLHSDTHYSGKATLDTQIAGVAERMQIQQGGKWLSADCGDVKPAR